MPHIETMYGVTAGANIHSLTGEQIPIFSEPSREIKELLRKLPAGSSVGIESHPDLVNRYTHGDKYFAYSESSISYWQHVEDLAKELKLDVVYLDDIDLTLKASRHMLSADNFAKLSFQTFYGSGPDVPRKDVNDLTRSYDRQAYAHRALGRYAMKVEREQALLRNIAATQPTVVIIRRGHGDMMVVHDESLLDAHGLSVGTYRSEGGISSGIFVDAEPDPNDLGDRILLLRRYNAVTQGRIDPENTPDYIGYWGYRDITVPERGLFELNLDDGVGNTGSIIDTLGDAEITDIEIDDKEIWFTKNYLQSLSDGIAIRDPIYYHLEPDEDSFRGVWVAENQSGPVVMKPFQPKVKLFTPLQLQTS